MAYGTITFDVQQVPAFSTAAVCVQGALSSLSYNTFDNCPSPAAVTSAPVLIDCICNNDLDLVSSAISETIGIWYTDCDQAEINSATSIFSENCALNLQKLGLPTTNAATITGTGTQAVSPATGVPGSQSLLFTPRPTAPSSSTGSDSPNGSALSTHAIIGIAIGGATFLILVIVALTARCRRGANRVVEYPSAEDYTYYPKSNVYTQETTITQQVRRSY